MDFNYDTDTEEYPTHITIPEGYWIFSHDVGYVESN